MNDETRRYCPNCGKPVTGRSDKKFCSESCRSMYNNRLSRQKSRWQIRIDRILKRNHTIMERLYESGRRKTTFYELSGMGFNFDYLTSLRENPDTANSYIIGCYEFMYVMDEEGNIVIDKRPAILQ